MSEKRVREALDRLEAHLGGALAAGADLSAALVRGAGEHGMSPIAGQAVLRELSQASMSVAEAMGHTGRGHRLLLELVRRRQILGFGDGRPDDGCEGFTGA